MSAACKDPLHPRLPRSSFSRTRLDATAGSNVHGDSKSAGVMRRRASGFQTLKRRSKTSSTSESGDEWGPGTFCGLVSAHSLRCPSRSSISKHYANYRSSTAIPSVPARATRPPRCCPRARTKAADCGRPPEHDASLDRRVRTASTHRKTPPASPQTPIPRPQSQFVYTQSPSPYVLDRAGRVLAGAERCPGRWDSVCEPRERVRRPRGRVLPRPGRVAGGGGRVLGAGRRVGSSWARNGTKIGWAAGVG